MKFLVVDDSITMRRIVVGSLGRMGYTRIIEAEDGRDALDKFDSTIDFVITDWNMPVMNGIELTKELRAREASSGVPILMVTTHVEAGDTLSAVGVTNYILKPFTVATLKEGIEKTLSVVAARA